MRRVVKGGGQSRGGQRASSAAAPVEYEHEQESHPESRSVISADIHDLDIPVRRCQTLEIL